jgi:uncharacterized membrane protein
MYKFSKKYFLVITLFVMVFISLLFPYKVLAADNNYYISNIVINATVESNGDMKVEENHYYVFKGSYNGIKRDVVTSGSDGISEISAEGYKNGVPEQNKVQITKDSDQTEIKIYSKSNNESKNFKINYTLKNVITKYNDLAELKWLFYKNTLDVNTNNITVYITLPKALNNGVKFYGEGPKRGTAQVENNKIKLQLSNMENDEVIGADVLFPSAWVNTSKVINLNREQYLDKVQNENNTRTALIIAAITVILCALFLVLLISSKKRKKAIKQYREQFEFFKCEYYSQLPSKLPPALVAKLLNKKIDADVFIATIINLCSKGLISFLEDGIKDKNEEQLCFKINEIYNENNLKEFEINLLKFLKEYSKDNIVLLSNLIENSNKTNFIRNFDHWTKLISLEADKLNFYIKIKGKKELTNEFLNEKLKWEGFKNYFKLHKEEIPINEETLSYLLVLGISKTDISNFEKSQNNYNSSIFMSYWFFNYFTTSYSSHISNNFTSGTSTSISSFSGGTGAGFGGGGGGGGF